ncbi:sensor histidine kinase, partial [Pseudomonas sp. BGM005]|nr:sensor histidine kinase [Pseudomonas sp. BG5]
DDLPKLFQPYYRARSATGIAGTGIGLNVVKQVVELHGGSVEVTSELGKGTTVTISLPIEVLLSDQQVAA